MTGVTATNPVDSRNTSVVDHWHDLRCRCCPPCERCDQRWVHNFDSCTDCGWCRWCAKHGGDVLPAFRPHCLTCHSTNHYACQECASCIGTVTDYGGRSRSDRRYCSNACRQRAYRHRKERTA